MKRHISHPFSIFLTIVISSLASNAQAPRSDSLFDGIPDSWRVQHFGENLSSPQAAALADSDSDGRTNLEEFVDGTDPTDNSSVKSVPIAISTVAGSPTLGSEDGPALEARFNLSLRGFEYDASGNLWVGEGRVLGFDDPGPGLQRLRYITPANEVVTFGGAEGGYLDGAAAEARFSFPADFTFDSLGNLFVLDRHRIRKISPAGEVTTFAGDAAGYAEGQGTNALFNTPRGITIDSQNNLYVADWFNRQIRKVTPSGLVTTLNTNEVFSSPLDIDMGPGGDLFVIDHEARHVKRITTAGESSIFATLASQPVALSFDASGAMYVSTITPQLIKLDSAGRIVWSFSAPGPSRDGPFGFARSSHIGKTRARSSTSVLFADNGHIRELQLAAPGPLLSFSPGATTYSVLTNVTIRSLAPGGVIRYTVDGTDPTSASALFSGSVTLSNRLTEIRAALFGGTDGDVQISGIVAAAYANDAPDGIPDAWRIAHFGSVNDPRSAPTADPDGDGANNFLEYLDGTNPLIAEQMGGIPTHITAYAGSAYGTNDGPRTDARFNQSVRALELDAQGTLWVGEGQVSGWDDLGAGYQRIRTISPSGLVTAFAGAEGRFQDGELAAARFSFPADMVFDSHGDLFVMDRHRIRKITTDGVVSTFAGNEKGYRDGTGTNALFNGARAMTIDADNNLWVVDWLNNAVRKVTPAAVVTTFATNFAWPHDIDIAPDGNFYVAEVNGGIKRLTSAGVVTPFVNPGGSVVGVSVDSAGNVYASIGHTSSPAIRKYSPAGALIWSINRPGAGKDGPIDEATISHVGKTRLLPDGSLLFADHYRIRRVLFGRRNLLELPPNQIFDGTFPISASSLAPYGSIHYTLDGSNPTASSPVLEGSLTVTNSTVFKATLFFGGVPLTATIERVFTKREDAPPQITWQPEDATIIAGADLRLFVTEESALAVNHQWFFKGEPIPGATSSILTIPGATAAAAGPYFVRVSNSNGFADSREANVAVNFRLSIAPGVTNGSVVLDPALPSYPYGSSIRVTARANEGYHFDAWVEPGGVAEPSFVLVVTNNLVLQPSFTRPATIMISASGSGTLQVSPAGPTYKEGQVVEIHAQPAAGYSFVGWSGDLEGGITPTNVIASGNKSIIANFRDVTPPLLTLDLPSPGRVASEFSALKGAVSSDGDLQEVFWEHNGARRGVLPLTDGKFDLPFLLARGTNTIVVSAVDASGNAATEIRTIEWAPSRILTLQPPSRVTEGGDLIVPILLESSGDVSGMTLRVNYSPEFLHEPSIIWLDPVADGLASAAYDKTQGIVTGTFSLGSTGINPGVVPIAALSFRIRSVPETSVTTLGLSIVDSSDAAGNSHRSGSWAGGGAVEILARRILGDNNANDRLDIGDANLVQRLLLGLDEARPWDALINDLNSSASLDAGDVTKILRVTVGLDPQPLPAAARDIQSLAVATNWVINGALLNLAYNEDKSLLTADVALTNLLTGISAARFTLDYDTNVLRLASASSLRAGPLTSQGSVLWNNHAGGEQFDHQPGKLSFAFSAPSPGQNTNGALGKITFEVNKDEIFARPSEIRLHGGEITHNGYDLIALSEIRAVVQADAPLPPRIEIASSGLAEGLTLHLTGEDGSYDVLVSTDLRSWSPIAEVSIVSGVGTFSEAAVNGGATRFYRLRAR